MTLRYSFNRPNRKPRSLAEAAFYHQCRLLDLEHATAGPDGAEARWEELDGTPRRFAWPGGGDPCLDPCKDFVRSAPAYARGAATRLSLASGSLTIMSLEAPDAPVGEDSALVVLAGPVELARRVSGEVRTALPQYFPARAANLLAKLDMTRIRSITPNGTVLCRFGQPYCPISRLGLITLGGLAHRALLDMLTQADGPVE